MSQMDSKPKVTGEQKILLAGKNSGRSTLGDLLFGFLMFLSILSGGLIVTYIGELLTGATRHGVASQLGLIAFLIGIVCTGVYQLRGRLKEKGAVRELHEEQTILNKAKSRGGIITVSEMALESGMRISDVKRAFGRLAATDVCHVDVTEDGEICYRFPSFQRVAALSSEALIMDPFNASESKGEKIQINVERI